MDHILENEGKPVPEAGAQQEQSGSSSTPMDVDDDEAADAAALGINIDVGEAKVGDEHCCTRLLVRNAHIYSLSYSLLYSEHQMLSMWQNLPKYRVGRIPR